jgi:hypothetical protein
MAPGLEKLARYQDVSINYKAAIPINKTTLCPRLDADDAFLK